MNPETTRPMSTQTAFAVSTAERSRRALVTGATGYVGGGLTARLLDDGWTVRVLTRDAASLDSTPWADRVEIVEGNATSRADLDEALTGVDVAYYLIHSMDGEGDFVERDRELATDFGAAAKSAGVQRLVYLSGLHPNVATGEDLSEHLASRVQVGDILLDSGVPTAVLQAAIVLGDGSASFDMLRYLTTRLPVVVGPSWLRNKIQPIAVDDVLNALAGAADLPAEVNRTFDIGGPDVLTYSQMIQRYAQVAGLQHRPVLTLPVVTPGLAAGWVGLVTPIPAGVAKPLVGSLVHEVVCKENDLDEYLPEHARSTHRIGFDDAVRRALRTVEPDHGLRNLVLTGLAVSTCAVVGSLATAPETSKRNSWYTTLDLPSWQPPGRVFPVAWTALYTSITIVSAAAITTLQRDEKDGEARSYVAALGSNLALNAGWSLTFFGAHRPRAATAVAAALAASSADLARRAGQTKPRRGVALVPYAAWCTFATALSAEIARRNPGAEGESRPSAMRRLRRWTTR